MLLYQCAPIAVGLWRPNILMALLPGGLNIVCIFMPGL